MTHLEVKHGTVIDAIGRERTGFIVFENGRPGYPFATQDKAIKHAEGIAHLRVVNGIVPKIIVDNEERNG